MCLIKEASRITRAGVTSISQGSISALLLKWSDHSTGELEEEIKKWITTTLYHYHNQLLEEVQQATQPKASWHQ